MVDSGGSVRRIGVRAVHILHLEDVIQVHSFGV